MANITLQLLFHPNVFGDPAAEGARIFDLLYAEACQEEKKDAFRATFPIYVTEHRNLGKIHPPLPEIPGILDQFWDGSMDRYRSVFRIKRANKKIPGKDGEPHKLKPLVQKIIEQNRRKKREAKAAALQEQTGCSLAKSALDTVKGSGSPSSIRAATWGVFNRMLHPGKSHRQGKSVGNDGSVDEENPSEETVLADFLESQARAFMAEGAKLASDDLTKEKNDGDSGTRAPKEAIDSKAEPPSLASTEKHEPNTHRKKSNPYEDYLCIAEHVEYVEGQPRVSEDSVLRKIDELRKAQQFGDGGPHEEFQRLKLLKDGSMEVSVSVDEAQDEVAN